MKEYPSCRSVVQDSSTKFGLCGTSLTGVPSEPLEVIRGRRVAEQADHSARGSVSWDRVLVLAGLIVALYLVMLLLSTIEVLPDLVCPGCVRSLPERLFVTGLLTLFAGLFLLRRRPVSLSWRGPASGKDSVPLRVVVLMCWDFQRWFQVACLWSRHCFPANLPPRPR